MLSKISNNIRKWAVSAGVLLAAASPLCVVTYLTVDLTKDKIVETHRKSTEKTNRSNIDFYNNKRKEAE